MEDHKQHLELYIKFQSGDRDAGEKLFTIYTPCLIRFGQNRGLHSDAVDIAQETLLKVLESPKQFSSGDRFDSWILTIARNQIWKLWDKARRGISRGLVFIENLDFEIEYSDPNNQEEDFESLDTVQIKEVMNLLSKDDQDIINLRVFGDWSWQQLAIYFGVSKRAAETRFQRALARARSTFENTRDPTIRKVGVGGLTVGDFKPHLSRLSPAEFEVINLMCSKNLDVSEVANLLNKEIHNVRCIVSRASKKVRKLKK